MRWRDIRFEKPTEKDGLILVKLHDGTERIWHWDMHAESRLKCWIPTSELPQPGLPGPIPDGWRPVDKAVDKKRTDEMFWLNGAWRPTKRDDTWDSGTAYIVPIEPPAPQYRPFANAAEFAPHRGRWVCFCDDPYNQLLPYSFNDKYIWHANRSITWDEMFSQAKFADDGSPFGVLITEATQ
jgi:hypothetical protein